MKKVTYTALLILVTMVHSCAPSQPKPEELVGKHTFELLQQMDTISLEAFIEHFLSLEELRDFAKDTTVEDTFRKAVTHVSKETHNKRIQQAYEMIKESGKRYEIDWNAISFREYPYTIREESGIAFQDGYLAFDHHEKKFVTKIVSINYKGEQRLFNLSNIEPTRK